MTMAQGDSFMDDAKYTVIYCRYSTEMQRKESCADQERVVRADLQAKGVALDNLKVIYDEAQSGTSSNRDGFAELDAMVERCQVRVVAVDDQSRLSRAANTLDFITDLVFSGGRFISCGEGIDTHLSGWELKVGILQIHHSQTIRDLQHRVRRGQRGRVDADGSAGDFPYGYMSFYLDPDWEAMLRRRGPKPAKGLRICDSEATVVRQVFDWFVGGRSVGWIARELTRLGVPKGRRASKPGWHAQQVHRLLMNRKYIGEWKWGATTVIRNSRGAKRQVPATDVVQRKRPELRIISDEIWNQVQSRIARLAETYGFKPGQRRRGPKPPTHPNDVHPRSLLGGLLRCTCGHSMWYRGSGGRRYYSCSGHQKGLCPRSFQVPAHRAEEAVVNFVTDLLAGWPDWMRELCCRIQRTVLHAASKIPEDRARDEKRLDELRRQERNLVDALADGTGKGTAIRERLDTLAAEIADVEARLAGYGRFDPLLVALPEESWIREHLTSWLIALADPSLAAARLRDAVASLTAEPVVAPGKKRGHVQLRLRIRGWRLLMTLLTEHLPPCLVNALPPNIGGDEPPEFVLALGSPTVMDQWASRIAAWRAEGVKWTEIVARTGLDLNRVFIAWRRFTRGTSDPP